MPRKSSARGGGSRHTPKLSSQTPAGKTSHAPVKASQAPSLVPVQPNGGGSVLGNIGGVIAEGMAFGTGSAVAHRAVDAVMGPRVVQHEHAPVNGSSPKPMPDSCATQSKAFEDCISSNGADIGKCQFYLDMLKECKRGLPAGM